MGKLAGLKKAINRAHDIAQKNAALPKEKGGLGLPADNTAIDMTKAITYQPQPDIQTLPEVVF